MTAAQFRACFRDANNTFHQHWSAQVGQPGYDKRAWEALHASLIRAWRYHAAAVGIPRDAPL